MAELNPTQIAFAQWLAKEELTRQKEVVDARTYYEGAQITLTTDRIRNLLGLASGAEVNLKLNVIRTVITAIVERLAVKKIQAVATTEQPGDDEATSDATKALTAWAEWVWKANQLDVKQDDVYTDAINDGEAFVIVDWDTANARPRMLPHPRYTDTAAGSSLSVDTDNTRAGARGDGFGCKIFYVNDDANQPVLRASKRWREELGNGKARLRLTEYYPDRIEKWDVSSGQPVAFRDEGDTAWPIPWVDSAGQPLGVPVFAATEPDGRPQAIDAWPIQDAVNQALLDLMAGNRLSAFRIFKIFGFDLTTDGKRPAADRSNWVALEPGGIFGTAQKGPNDAAFEPIDGTSPEAFLATLNELVQKAASVTDTPLSRFQITGQVAGADTQQEYKEPLYAKVEKRQLRFAQMWMDAFSMALKLERLFGDRTLAESADFDIVWKPAKPRQLSELVQEASAKKASGVPEEIIWQEVWGYSQERIDAMKQTDSYRNRQAMTQASLAGLNAA